MGRRLICILCLLIIFSNCGRKIKLPTNLPELGGGTFDTTYVPVGEPWEKANDLPFDHPQDVHIGFDGYIYIADTDNDRIVKLDQSGEFIDQYYGAENPASISQDRLFRLLATGDSIIYKKGTQEQDFVSIYIAPDVYDTFFFVMIDTVQTDTGIFIDTVDTFRVDTSATVYEGIAPNPLPFSGYAEYFACDFTRSEITRFLFYEPATVYNLGPAIPTGYTLGKTAYPVGIFTYLTQTGFNLIFCQALYYYSVQLLDGEDFSPIIPWTDSTDIYLQDTFDKPEDSVVDEFGNIFVVDSEKNAVLKFSKTGVLILSFGTEGTGEKQFQNPKGIAYANKIVYVADSGNNRILRFKLSTDIPE